MIVGLLGALAACQHVPMRSHDAGTNATVDAGAWEGVFDNHQQVWLAQQDGATPWPEARFAIAALQRPGWHLMDVELQSASPLHTRWLLHQQQTGAGLRITPYHALVPEADPEAGSDVRQWTALAACTLEGSRTQSGFLTSADVSACMTIAPGIGTAAALLPIALEFDGQWLRARLYSDQARGADARHEARRVEIFDGWAVINGGGPQASADNADWHVNAGLSLGSEGGRQPLVWRDGQPSGYELLLERVTYRDGELPILKLSLRDTRSDATVAYAWADEDARRIGINLGWLQVGLDR